MILKMNNCYSDFVLQELNCKSVLRIFVNANINEKMNLFIYLLSFYYYSLLNK